MLAGGSRKRGEERRRGKKGRGGKKARGMVSCCEGTRVPRPSFRDETNLRDHVSIVRFYAVVPTTSREKKLLPKYGIMIRRRRRRRRR